MLTARFRLFMARLSESEKKLSRSCACKQTTPDLVFYLFTSETKAMKSETSLNFMLVVFCFALIGFVLLNVKISDTLNKKQADLEHSEAVKP